MPNPAAPVRQTRPPSFSLVGQGGLAVVPRPGLFGGFSSGVFTGPLADGTSLLNLASAAPGRLSEILGLADPTYAKAQSNWLAALAAPGTARLVAYKAGQTGQDARDDAATGEAADWMEGMGCAVGGLSGVRSIGAQALLHYGLWALEAVPGPRASGVARLGFVDPMSLGFEQDGEGNLLPYQKQRDAPDGKRLLDTATFFWYSLHRSATNPFGGAVFSAGPAQALTSRHFAQDVRDGVHNAAWARYVYKYNQEVLYAIATKPASEGGLGLPPSLPDASAPGGVSFPARDWVNAQLADVRDYLDSLQPGENMVADASGGVDALSAGSFSGLEGVFDFEDTQYVRALDEMPTTMGSPKAGAQTYTTAEWATQAAKQETVRDGILDPVVRAANLHFRLQGRPLVVRAEFDPIRTSDAVQDANAEATEFRTRALRWMFGLITKEDFAIQETGSGLPGHDSDAYDGPQPTLTGGVVGSASGGLTQTGTTQEERDANP